MTSISDQTALMVAAIEGFKTVLPGALAAKAQEAEQADATNELQGQDFPTLSTSLDADLTTHENNHNNPHADTAAGVNTYKTSEVDAKLVGIIPNASLPFSRFGSLSYLPVGVSGSFEGATMNFESRRYPCILENDGTFVFLRNGTTGSKMGVYYAYVKNALQAGALATPIRTNMRYQPAYFPAGYTARYVYKSDTSCLLGRLQNASGALGDYFLSLTNGTFDATKHVGAIIPAASFPPLVNSSVSVEAFVGNSNIYLIVTAPTDNPGSDPVEMTLWSIPLSSVQSANGGNVTPTQLTGWTTTGFGGTFTGSTIRVANKQISTNASDLPMVVYPASPPASYALFMDNDGNINTESAQDPASGLIRIRVTGLAVATVTSTGISTLSAIAFWLSVNPTALTAALESPATTPGSAAYNSSAGTMNYSGSVFQATPEAYLPEAYQGGELTSCWSKAAGYWFGVRDSDPPDYGANVSRAQTNAAYANRYAALASSAGVNGNTNTGFLPQYGTALGGRMLGTWPLPGGYLLAASYGPKQDGTSEWGPVLIQPGASGYTYTSQYNGTLTGFAPSVLRKRVSDMGLSNDTYSSLVSEISAAGVVTTSGGRFMDGYNNSGPLSVTVSNNVLVGSGTISCDNSVLLALKAAAWPALGISVPPTSVVEVMIPQNTAIPPFAFLTWVDSNKHLFAAVLELSITGGSRTGAITSFGIVSQTSQYLNSNGTSILAPRSDFLWTSGSCTIYEASDAYLVGFRSKVLLSIPGTGATHSVRFAMPKTTNRPDWTTVGMTVYGGTYNTSFWTAYPGLGFGETRQDPTASDNYTKIILNVKATTLAQFKSWATQSTSVLTSQDVAQGWLVYFTEITPVILNGQYLQIQPVTFDLTTIQANPANSTFYVYVTTNNGVASYVISTTPQAETVNNMFIGTIVTGASSITAINLYKVSRIDKYRLATTPQGSAISVSSGNPDVAGHLNWT